MKIINSIDKHPGLQIHYRTRSPDELKKDELKAALKKL